MSLSLPHPTQPKRSKTILSPEGTTAKFLYTIIKQLDLKSIDWNEVASQLDITNGHAARMRYSRFKTQIEGLSKENKPKARSAGKEPKTKQKGKEKRSYEDIQLDQSYSDRLFMEDDGDSKKKVRYELAGSSHAHMWNNNIIKEEQDEQLPSPIAKNDMIEQNMQQIRVRNPTDASTDSLDPRGDHLKTTPGSIANPQNHQAIKHETSQDSISIAPAMGLRRAYSPNVAGNMLSRPQYRHYYPSYNGFRYGPQLRPYRLPYQARAPQYERFPSSHYQQLLHQSAYDRSAYELAIQASYPWPYSEASINQSAQRNQTAMPAMHADYGTTAYNDVDFNQFAKDLEEWNGDTSNILESISDITTDTTAGKGTEIASEDFLQGTGVIQSKSTTPCETAEPIVIPDQDQSIQMNLITTEDVAEQGKLEDHATGRTEDAIAETTSSKHDIIVKVEPEILVL